MVRIKKSRYERKRLLALILTVVMLLTQYTVVFAEFDDSAEITVPGERLASAREAAEDGAVVYFGTGEYTVPESGGILNIPIYREGDASEAASIVIRTLDFSAVYGEDYILLGENLEEFPCGISLLERAAGFEAGEIPEEGEAEENGEEDLLRTYEFDTQTEELTEVSPKSLAQLEDEYLEQTENESAELDEDPSSEPAPEPNSDAAPDAEGAELPDTEKKVLELSGQISLGTSGKSKLALEKESETGIEAREVTESIPQSVTETILSQMTADVFSEIIYSGEQIITFAEGSKEANLRIQILDDKLSEGAEMLSVIIVAADGAEVFSENSSLSLTIQDDEAYEKSRISFSDANYQVTDGIATIRLIRENAEYSIAGATLYGVDEETGILQALGVAAFAPYETELVQQIEVGKLGSLVLGQFDAAEEGEISSANLLKGIPEEADLLEAPVLSGNILSAAGDDLSAEIKIQNKTYTIRYKKNETIASIYDTNYSPELEVGKYFIVANQEHGGMFKGEYTGSNPSWHGGRSNRYEIDSDADGDLRKGYWYMYYYSSWIAHKGSSGAYIPLEYSQIDAPYYQVVMPDWQQTSTAFTGQRSYFDVSVDQDGNSSANVDSDYRGDDFGRRIDTGLGVRIKDLTGKITVEARIRDAHAGETPKLTMKFYGVAAMYKRFRVSIESPDPIKVKTGFRSVTGSYYTTDLVPAIAKVKCGAQVINGPQDERDMMANTNADKSNMVFELGKNEIYGVSHIYGQITGYTITISPNEDSDISVVKDYPADFFTFLDSKVGKSTSVISYTKSDVEAEKSKVLTNLQTVPFDAYFIDWIENCQKKIYETDEYSGKGYCQKLRFKPVLKPQEVKVEVVSPAGSYKGSFTDTQLSLTTPENPHIYYAGDRLDLSAAADNSNYEAVGYEVSVDDGKFDKICSTQYLLLEPGHAYKIRPLIAEKTNRIEIQPADKNLEVLNTIPQELLKGYKNLEGKYILDINPEEDDIYKRMSPQPGKLYTIETVIKGNVDDRTEAEKQAGIVKENRVEYIDPVSELHYTGNVFYLRAETSAVDNLVRVGRTSVNAEDIRESSVSGTIAYQAPALREDAQIHITPANGYSLMITTDGTQGSSGVVITQGMNTAYAGAVSDIDGKFELTGIRALSGERRQILIGNGINDSQVADIVFDSSGKLEAGLIELTYPKDAPKIATLNYDYTKESSRSKGDVSQNTVRVFDDSLILTAVVDGNGHKVKEVVFTLHHSNGRVDGSGSVYTAVPVETGSNVFSVQIDDMISTFSNGDYFTVHLVDAESMKMNAGGEIVEVPVTYPEVWTGLTMFTENEYIAPKELDFDFPDEAAINIPFIGTTGGGLQSGPIGLTRTNWPDGTGYTITLNLEGVIYGNKGGLTPQQKLDAFNNYREKVGAVTDAKRALAEAQAKEAEINGRILAEEGDTATNILADLSGAERKKLDDELAAAQANTQEQLSKVTDAKDAFAGLAKGSAEPIVSVSAVFCLELEFVKIPIHGEYVLAETAITVGGTVTASKTWYFVMVYAPVFTNVTFTDQANVILGGVCDPAIAALEGGSFDGYSGNIRELLDNRSDYQKFMSELDLILKLKGQVGVGMNGVVGARGFMQVNFRGQRVKGIEGAGKNGWGVVVGVSGGFGVDLLFSSFEVSIANVQYGRGTLKDATDVTFLGGLSNLTLTAAPGQEDAFIPQTRDPYYEQPLLATSAGSSPVLSEEAEETVSVLRYEYGTDDMTQFETGSYTGKPGEVQRVVLLKNAADRTRPQMTDIEDGRKLLVFIGKRNGEGDESCLYYAIGNKDGSWSEPKPVSGDSTFDTAPVLVKTDDYIVAVWNDTTGNIDELNDFKETANSFGLSAAVFDPKTDSFGPKTVLTDNEYFNVMPHAAAYGNKLICTFLARDINGASDITKLADYVGTYSAAKYVVFDADTMEVVRGASEESGEHFIRTKTEELEDPLVTDLDVETVEVGGVPYAVMAYSVDTDENLNTFDDRQIYMMFQNLENGNAFFPILVNKNTFGDAAPALTKLNGRVYLTWVSGGSDFHLLEANEVAEALQEAGSLDSGKNPLLLASGAQKEDRSWYVASAANAGVPEEEDDASFYKDLASNELPISTIALREYGNGVSEYKLTSDGEDVYIFFTDNNPELTATGKEIFGFRYSSGGSAETEAEDDANIQRVGFTAPVQITAYDMVLDEFDAVMDEDRTLHVITNYFRQIINSQGELQYGQNRLLYLKYEPEGSVEIDEDSINVYDHLIGGEKTEISFNVKNTGLMRAEGYRASVAVIGSTGTREIWSAEINRQLDPGKSDTISLPWDVPESVQGLRLKFSAEELGEVQKKESVAYVNVPYEERLEISDPEITFRDGRMTVRTSVSNTGNADAEAFVMTLRDNNEAGLTIDGITGDLYGEQKIDSLASGETAEVEFSFDVTPECFDSWGRIQLAAAAEREEEMVNAVFGSFIPGRAVLAEISAEGEPTVKGPNDALQLSSFAAPWGDAAGTPVYTSSDSSIAVVDQDGRVTGVSNGTVLITVYYPVAGVYAAMEVTVTDMPNVDPISPLTGDSSRIALWISLWVISGGMIAGSMIYDKKKRLRNQR